MNKTKYTIILFIGTILLILNYLFYNLDYYNNGIALLIVLLISVFVYGSARKYKQYKKTQTEA